MKCQKYVDLDFDNTWSHFNMAKFCYGVLQDGISDGSCPRLFSEFSFSYDIAATQFLRCTRVTEAKRHLCRTMEDPLQPVKNTIKKGYI